MNKVVLQLWEESNISGEIFRDGCSLHINITERDNYVNSIYKNRTNPNKYDRVVGDSINVFVSDVLYNTLLVDNNIKIPEPAFKNLLKLEDIVYNKSEI